MDAVTAALNAKRREQEALDARRLTCVSCGIPGGVKWYSFVRGKWLPTKKVYGKAKKKLLCDGCANAPTLSLSPTWKSLSPLQREAMRGLCFKTTPDGKHIINPEADHNCFAFLPHFYPAYWLGEKQIICRLTNVTTIKDCHILTFVPDKGQDYMLDEHMKEYGMCFTALPPYYNVTLYKEKVQWYRWADYHDTMRTSIRKVVSTYHAN